MSQGSVYWIFIIAEEDELPWPVSDLKWGFFFFSDKGLPLSHTLPLTKIKI